MNQVNDFVKVSVTEHYDPLKHDYTVVYFYPKASTPGCTVQAQGLRDIKQQLDTENL